MRLEVTRRSDLAIRALLALSEGRGRTKAAELADEVGTSKGFLTQVMNPLVQQGWVRSDPGPTGDSGALVGSIVRITRVGFEVRVDVSVGDEAVQVTMTRTHFQALSLMVGDPVWVRPTAGAQVITGWDPSLGDRRRPVPAEVF